MTIAFTGGGTGGHFYPIIAIAEGIADLVREEHLVAPRLYFLAPTPYDEKALFENGISYIRVPAGKMRRYFSLSNIFGVVVTLIGTISAFFVLFRLYPDVVVSKGGYGSVPAVLAARILRIPIVIHESDAKPGRANLIAGKFASKIAITFESAASYFPKSQQDKIARTGIPIRKTIMRTETEGARELLNLDPSVPTILIIGGSQGSVKINEAVIGGLVELVSFANIIHQTGQANINYVEGVARVALSSNAYASRYHPYGFLDEITLQRASGVANLIISRAGATSIAEIGLWQKPAILIPIPESISHDQKTNAYSYAGTGSAVVLEEQNMTAHLLASEAKRIIGNKDLMHMMSEHAKGFTDPESAHILAHEILATALSHEV